MPTAMITGAGGGLGFGRAGDCHCSALVKRQYLGKLSGPLLDRVDLQVWVPPATRASLAAGPGESSAVVASRVAAARGAQAERWKECAWSLNSSVPGTRLRCGPWRLPPAVTAQSDRPTTMAGTGIDGRIPQASAKDE